MPRLDRDKRSDNKGFKDDMHRQMVEKQDSLLSDLEDINGQIRTLGAKKMLLNEKHKSLGHSINLLYGEDITPKYSGCETWPDRIEFVLKRADAFVSGRRIIDLILEEEKPTSSSLGNSIKSTVLNNIKRMLESKRLVRMKAMENEEEVGPYLYGVLTWEDADGKTIKERNK